MIEKIKHHIRKLKDPSSLGHKRSNQWPRVRKEHLEKEPICQCCGSKLFVEVHHIVPFSEDPSKELDPNNLITLCESKKWMCCHLCTGHLGSYKNSNPNVRKDAQYIKAMLKQ